MKSGGRIGALGEALPVIAIGGGLAGAAFALELARNGRRAIVLERTVDAHHKVCGEFLSAEADAILRSFGLAPHALGAAPVTHFRLARGKRQALAALPFSAVALSRLRLDQLLLEAAERAGALVLRGVRVTGVAWDGAAVCVRSERRTWRAAAVALATGKRSLRGLGAPPGSMVGFKLHLDAPRAAAVLGQVVQLAFFPQGYVGAARVENGTLSLAWVMQEHLLRTVGHDWAQQRAHLLRQAPALHDLLDGARPLLPKPLATAAIPYGFLRACVVAPAIYPVGDQFAVVPSFTGDGMAIALYTGLAAARSVLKHQPAADYQRELLVPLRRQFRLAGGLGRLLASPWTSPLAIGAARFLPALVSRLAGATRLTMSEDIAARVAPWAHEG
jgi:flavin-dependent dehydrogenase